MPFNEIRQAGNGEERQAQPEVLAKFFARREWKKVAFTPEYQHMKFFFIVPDSPKRGDDQKSAGSFVSEQMTIAKEILSGAKDSKITFFFNELETKEWFWEEVAKDRFLAGMPKRRLAAKIGEETANPWAMDIGKPTGGEKGEYLFGWYEPEIKGATENRLTMVREALSQDIPYAYVPAFLTGGNIAKGVSENGEKIVFVGASEARKTREKYADEYNYGISDEEMRRIYSEAFGADRAIILGEKKRGEFREQLMPVFHIDQAICFPRDGTAIMIEPKNREDVPDGLLSMLDSYERQLREAGFEIIKIPTTSKNIEKYQSYSNAVSIADGGKTKLIMPSFVEDSPIGKEEQQKIEDEIKETLGKAGMDVVFVKNCTFGIRGNTHCLTGALSVLGMKTGKGENTA